MPCNWYSFVYLCIYNFRSPFYFIFSQEKLWGVNDGASQHAQTPEEQQKERRDVHVWHAERYHALRWHLGTDGRRGRAGELAATSPKGSYFTHWARLKHRWWWKDVCGGIFNGSFAQVRRKALIEESRLTWLLALIIKPLGQPPADSKVLDRTYLLSVGW